MPKVTFHFITYFRWKNREISEPGRQYDLKALSAELIIARPAYNCCHRRLILIRRRAELFIINYCQRYFIFVEFRAVRDRWRKIIIIINILLLTYSVNS